MFGVCLSVANIGTSRNKIEKAGFLNKINLLNLILDSNRKQQPPPPPLTSSSGALQSTTTYSVFTVMFDYSTELCSISANKSISLNYTQQTNITNKGINRLNWVGI